MQELIRCYAMARRFSAALIKDHIARACRGRTVAIDGIADAASKN